MMSARDRAQIGLCALAMVAASAGLASAQASKAAPSARQRLDHATQLHQAGDFAGAAREYEAFLKSHPDVADARSNLAAAYVRLGRLGEAIEQYKKALALGNASDATAVRFNLGLAYYKAARLDEAKQALAKVLAAQPEHDNARLLLANCHLSAGENKKAIALLAPYEARRKEDRAFAYVLGTAYLREGEIEHGQALVDVVLRQGESAEAHFMMGTAQMARGDAVAASLEFRRALELDPQLPSANALLGRTLSQMSKADEAAECFRRELARNPYDFESNLLLGMHLHKAEQKYDEALVHYQRALRARPSSPEARYQIGLVYLMTGREAEALALIEGVVKDVPDFLEGHATLTRLYYRLGRKDDAERHRAIADELRARREREGLAAVRAPSS
jgi:tetratricopeptide (TPR) repeat protein